MNELISRLANNRFWLYKVLGPISERDEFIRTLIDISKKAYEDGNQF